MSWTDVDLTNIPTDIDLLPEEKEFVFELLPGARYGRFQQGRVEAAARVAEGEFTGRVLYFSYPDPTEQPWSIGVFARMIKALGPADEGEDPVAYLNRVAGQRFVSKVRHRRVDAEGGEQIKQEIKIGNVKPVANLVAA